MEKSSKELSEFIKGVNKGIVDAMFMRVNNPVHPSVEVLCCMDTLHVKFDVRVNADGHVTHGQDVAAKLHFEFSYKPEKIDKNDAS